MEHVDILLPPTFEKSGIIKTRKQAIANGDWIGTFNLWILQSTPVPSIVYQKRSTQSTWAPNTLDVTAGGHYSAGEKIYDGLREVREELGKNYETDTLLYLGRKLHVSPDTAGFTRHNVVEVFFTIDNSPLESYKLETSEVAAIVSCPIEDLIKVHSSSHAFQAKGLTNDGKPFNMTVHKDSFPYNWDNYHFKIALFAQRYLNGESNILY